MNPLAKVLSTVLLLAASALGTGLGHDVLPFGPSSDPGTGDGADGNATGNQTSDGNSTTPADNSTAPAGNATGNQTSDGNSTAPADNSTAPDGNATADDEDDASDEAAPSCMVAVDDRGDDLFPGHHEWEWRVGPSISRIEVDFDAQGGIPSLGGGHSTIRLVDGAGRTVASGDGGGAWLHADLERGSESFVDGQWHLVFDSGEMFSGYDATVSLNC